MSLRIPKGSALVIAALLLLEIFCWIEVDLYAPSFPQIRRFFGTTEEMIQWTLSLNFLGYFLSSLMVGPLADSLGRRPVALGVGVRACFYPTIFAAFPDMKGSASSLCSAIRMMVMAAAIGLNARLYGDSFRSVGLVILVTVGLGFPLLLLAQRRTGFSMDGNGMGMH